VQVELGSRCPTANVLCSFGVLRGVLLLRNVALYTPRGVATLRVADRSVA